MKLIPARSSRSAATPSPCGKTDPPSAVAPSDNNPGGPPSAAIDSPCEDMWCELYPSPCDEKGIEQCRQQLASHQKALGDQERAMFLLRYGLLGDRDVAAASNSDYETKKEELSSLMFFGYPPLLCCPLCHTDNPATQLPPPRFPGLCLRQNLPIALATASKFYER
jgi:hypothetical protein